MQAPGRIQDKKTSKIAVMGLLLAIALILAYVETLIPLNFGVPGIKLGLANLCVVAIICLYGFKEAAAVNLMRILLAGFMFGSMSSIMYSLAGAALSMVCMYLIYKTGRFSIGGVSLAGGVMHNVGQCIIACLVVSDYRVSIYLPVLIIAGAVTGIVLGYIVGLMVPRLSRILEK